METVENIRNLRRRGEPIAGIARKTGVSEPTVRKYLRQEDFSPKPPVREAKPSKLDPYKQAIDGWLEEDRNSWHKQRHTARRIHCRLVDELGADVSYGTVQRYVKDARARILGEAPSEYLDLEWPPGEAQVDFGQADFVWRDVTRRLHYLTVTFPYSNVGLTQVFPGENAECVCEGLQAVFRYIGGVPTRLVFDNATGVGRKTADSFRLAELFRRFAAHFGFAYSFCNPDSGHEKGCVENKVGAIRRNMFVSKPSFDNVRRYNESLLDRCMARSSQLHYRKEEPEENLFVEDRMALLPLPEAAFSAVRYETFKADKYGKVCVEDRHWYSTSPSLGKKKVIVGFGAFEMSFFSMDGELVATHERAYGDKATDTCDPASQLSLLCRKPGGWVNSRVRFDMPSDLREYMDGLDRESRKDVLRILRDESEKSGYSAAVEAARQLAAFGRINAASVAMLAAGIANGFDRVEYEEAVDLREYDVAFSCPGKEGVR